MVDRDAIFERVRAAGIGGAVAADRAGALARRVGRVVKAGAGQPLVEGRVDHAWLDDGVSVAEIDFPDFAHPGEHDHHAAAHRQPAAGEAGARTTRDERHAALVAKLHHRGDFGSRVGKHRHARAVLLDDESVALVDGQIGMRIQHAVRAQQAAQLVGNAVRRNRIHRACLYPHPNL